MDGYVVHGGIGLARGTLARIEDGEGILVYVWEGELWVTQERDRRDYFVGERQWFQLDRRGSVLLYAMRRSSITLTAPVPAYYARRISLLLPGTRSPRVLYDRAQESGGRLGGLKHRLARLWFGAYSPASRPTTAGL